MREHYMQLEAVPDQSKRRVLAIDFDIWLLMVTLILCAIGFLMVYSASISPSYLASQNNSNTYFFSRHLRNFGIGAVIMFLMTIIDYHIWKRLSVWVILFSIFMLLAVLIFGQERFAAQRSLWRGSVQPGEMAKLAVVIYMAAWLASWHKQINRVTYGLIPFTLIIGTTCALVIVQPDLSTSATILVTALAMFFLAGAAWTQIGAMALGSLTAGYLLVTQVEYARSRITQHLDAVRDLTKANDHVQAAIEAFLNGQLFGVGLGEGKQKFGRLPFPHTDSIFAVIGEELGLVGAFVVLGLFFVLVYRGFLVGKNAPDLFGALLSAGVCIWIAVDAMLNIAVMTALAPPTGVPLPFISFGGSSLITAMAGIGLILSVSRQTTRKPFIDQQQRSREAAIVQKSTEGTHETPGISRRHGRGHISRVSRRRGSMED